MPADDRTIKAQRANKVALVFALKSVLPGIPDPISYRVIQGKRGDQCPMAIFPYDARIEKALSDFDKAHSRIIDDCKRVERAHFNPDGQTKPARKG